MKFFFCCSEGEDGLLGQLVGALSAHIGDESASVRRLCVKGLVQVEWTLSPPNPHCGHHFGLERESVYNCPVHLPIFHSCCCCFSLKDMGSSRWVSFPGNLGFPYLLWSITSRICWWSFELGGFGPTLEKSSTSKPVHHDNCRYLLLVMWNFKTLKMLQKNTRIDFLFHRYLGKDCSSMHHRCWVPLLHW